MTSVWYSSLLWMCTLNLIDLTFDAFVTLIWLLFCERGFQRRKVGRIGRVSIIIGSLWWHELPECRPDSWRSYLSPWRLWWVYRWCRHTIRTAETLPFRATCSIGANVQLRCKWRYRSSGSGPYPDTLHWIAGLRSRDGHAWTFSGYGHA